MCDQEIQWFYADERLGRWEGPMSLLDLDALKNSGKIQDYTHVTNTQIVQRQGPESGGIMYSQISRSEIYFTPRIEEFFEDRKGKQVTIFSGQNNCGKTYLLKQLFSLVGRDGYLISCNRFSHVDVLNTRNLDRNENRHYYDNFMQNFYTSRQNTENNEMQLERVITSLKDGPRNKLFELCERLLGNKFSLKRIDPENTFSSFYVDMDGENLRYGSSGTRLLLMLLGIMLNDQFKVLLIDEPEIGLSPGIQSIFAKILYDNVLRNEYFPHLRQIYIATHSHLFLDRSVFSNNFIVKKVNKNISISVVKTVGDLHDLQFNMLGNELESAFLPSAIIIAEGESDVSFLTKIVRLHIPNRKVAIVRGGGDGEIQNKLNFFKEAFGDISTSPYRNRVFVVLDKINSVKIDRLVNQGLPRENINVWSMNGIEYYYPKELVSRTFNCSIDDLRSIDLNFRS